MDKQSGWVAAGTIVLFFALGGLLNGRDEGSWQALFDGRTTNGWKGFKKDSFPSHRWIAEDGCLRLLKGKAGRDRTTGRGGDDIISVDTFDDFELRFEWRIAASSNSGIKYFVSEERKGPIGHEYQIIDDDAYRNTPLAELRHTGVLYDLLPAPAARSRPVGRYNHSRILVRGNHVEHWLNDVRVLEYELGSPELQAAIAKSKFKNVPGFGTKFTTPILLQDHGTEVWFRSIKIRRLK